MTPSLSVLTGPEAAFAYSFAALIGLLIGSFYTATASRVLYYFYGPGRKGPARWREFFSRPSFCFDCERPIPRLYLIPVAGYFWTERKCAHCHAPISPWTLAGEVFPGLLLPLLLLAGWSWPAAFFTILLCGQLYVSILTDHFFFALDYENSCLVALWAGAAAFFLTDMRADLLQTHLLTALGVLLILALLLLLARGRGLGAGDLPLAAALGLYFGWPWSLVVFQLAAAGSIVYILVIVNNRRAPAPFGVFMAFGAFATIIVQIFWTTTVEFFG